MLYAELFIVNVYSAFVNYMAHDGVCHNCNTVSYITNKHYNHLLDHVVSYKVQCVKLALANGHPDITRRL